jgi:hypothetical protein
MHAVEIAVRFDDRAAATAELDALTAQVSTMPGFIAGYWVGFPGEKGTALIVFASEEAAEGLANMARTSPAGGGSVTTESVAVGEVMAYA